MRKILILTCTLFLVYSGAVPAAAAQSAGGDRSAGASSRTQKKRGPVVRASREQGKQAQAMLKQRNLYQGEVTGKLDPETRAGLRKFQEAEGIKATGTLNRVTLEKMNIPLTERQRAL